MEDIHSADATPPKGQEDHLLGEALEKVDRALRALRRDFVAGRAIDRARLSETVASFLRTLP